MAQAAKEVAGVFCSSLKQIMQMISSAGRFPVCRSESIVAMQGAEYRRSERGVGGQGSNPAKVSVTLVTSDQVICRRILLLCGQCSGG